MGKDLESTVWAEVRRQELERSFARDQEFGLTWWECQRMRAVVSDGAEGVGIGICQTGSALPL